MASASYAQLVARTSSLLHDHEDLKGIISAAKAGDMLAVLDRNELQGEWRKARLLRLEDTNEMPTARPNARERTRPTMAHSRPLRSHSGKGLSRQSWTAGVVEKRCSVNVLTTYRSLYCAAL